MPPLRGGWTPETARSQDQTASPQPGTPARLLPLLNYNQLLSHCLLNRYLLVCYFSFWFQWEGMECWTYNMIYHLNWLYLRFQFIIYFQFSCVSSEVFQEFFTLCQNSCIKTDSIKNYQNDYVHWFYSLEVVRFC